MTIQQRRAIFDLVCSVIVLAVLVYAIGTTIGCATAAKPTATSAATLSAVRQRPIRIDEQIVRVDDWNCRLVTGPGAVAYTQGGVVRSITAPFPCPNFGNGKAMWGSGQRRISIEYNDGTYSSLTEWWP